MDNTHQLYKYSANLIRISKILRIILNELELQQLNRIAGNRISWNYFSEFAHNTVLSVLNVINKEYGDTFVVWNGNDKIYECHASIAMALVADIFKYPGQDHDYEKDIQEKLRPFQQDLSENLILTISYQQLEKLKGIVTLLEEQRGSVQPKRKDYTYVDGVLSLIRIDNTFCPPLNLSNCPALKPVFECFLYLFEDTGKTSFDREEILKKYKELNKVEIEWESLIDRKSTIMGKMINPTSCLKSRIVWEYDKNQKKFIFAIKPLSDK